MDLTTPAGEQHDPGRVELDRTTYVLRFDGPPLAGVVVRARRATAGGHVDLVVGQALGKATGGGIPELAAAAAAGEAAAADGLYRIFRAMGGALLEWNIDDRGEPVPATLDGLLSLELEHALEIVEAWLAHTAHAERDRRATEVDLQLPIAPLG